MQREPHIRLLGFRNHRLQEIFSAPEQILQRMRAFLRRRRQIFHARIIKPRQSRSAAPEFFLIPFGDPVRVKVIFDARQPRLPGRPRGLNNILNLPIAIRTAPDDIVHPPDHRVHHGHPLVLQRGQSAPQRLLGPGRPAARGRDHVEHAHLLQRPVRRRIPPRIGADLRNARTHHIHGPRRCRPRRLRIHHRRHRSRPRGSGQLHQTSARNSGLHGRSRTQILRKLTGSLLSPCACSLIGAESYFL